MMNDQNTLKRSNQTQQRHPDAAREQLQSQKFNSIGQRISQRVPRSLAQSQKESYEFQYNQSSGQIGEYRYIPNAQLNSI